MPKRQRLAGSVTGATDQANGEKVVPGSSPSKRPIETPPVVLAPLVISQHTHQALGFKTPRSFLEWVVEYGVPHVRRGKDRFVEAAIALQYLRAAKRDARETKRDTATADEEADRVLATIGRRRLG